MDFKSIGIVFLGGGLGSALRFVISKSLYPLFSNTISGTFTVNIIGSLIIGLLIGFEIKNIIDKPLYVLLVTGFCGGFTTFSAFALENYSLFKSGDYIQALTYIFLSVILGILAVGFGFFIARQF
jgi:CrcB protein